VESTGDDEQILAATAKSLLGGHADRFLQGCDLIERSHPRAEPHYYLSLPGTHDRHRGRGIGTALVEETLAPIDAAGMPAFLTLRGWWHRTEAPK